MAKIKGVQLKSIKDGIGHDFRGFQANIYLNNKKIGYVLDEGYGGILDVQIHEPEKREEFLCIAKQYKEENPSIFSSEEALIYDLLTLRDRERTFKIGVKKGYTMIVCLDYYPRDKEGKVDLDKPIPQPTEDIFFLASDKTLVEVLKEKNPPKYDVYRTLGDFIIN